MSLAVHGFPLDWNLWQIDEWPAKIAEIRAVTALPVWVSEVGVSIFGAEEVQEWGLRRTAELLVGRVPRIHWYSLYDLPSAWEATTRHREAEGSSYYRHFYMGLLREDGTPKPSCGTFAKLHAGTWPLPVVPFRGSPAWTTAVLDEATWRALSAHWPVLGRQLSAQRDSPGSTGRWTALADFDVTVTFCFTPEHRGIAPHHTSPPLVPAEFADFCGTMVRRYA